MSLASGILSGGAPVAPVHWKHRRLRDLVHLVNGYPFPSDSFGPDGDVPLVRIRDLVSQDSETYVSGQIPIHAVVRNGDVIIGMDGDFNVATWCRGPAALNQRLCLLRPRETVDMRFIAYALPSLLKIINDLTFSTTVKHLSSGDLLNERLLIPPIKEQRHIADFLDVKTVQADQMVTRYRSLIDALEKRRWSLFCHLVERMTAPPTPLRRVLEFITDGPFGSAFSSSDYSSEGVAVVRLGNIGFAQYRLDDQAFIPIDLYREFYRYRVQEGDLLIAGLGDVRNHAGRACVAPDLGPAIVKGKCFCARVAGHRANADFLSLLLSSPLGEQGMASRGSTRAMINLDVVKSAVLPLPQLADQEKIVDVMSAVDATVGSAVKIINHQQKLVNERRQALITAAVTGQIDVTTARGVGV